MTYQAHVRLDDDLAADVQAYASSLSQETGLPVSFNAAVTVLLRRALRTAQHPQDEVTR